MDAPLTVSPSPSQDWQEIVSLYEKDNTYLGKSTLRGHASTGEPVLWF